MTSLGVLEMFLKLTEITGTLEINNRILFH